MGGNMIRAIAVWAVTCALVALAACGGKTKAAPEMTAPEEVSADQPADLAQPDLADLGRPDPVDAPGEAKDDLPGPEDTVAVADTPDEINDTAPADLVETSDIGQSETVSPLPCIPDLPEEGKSCSDALTCGLDKGCGGADDVECWSPCIEGLSELATWQFYQLGSCWDIHCAEVEAADLEFCRWDHCPLEAMACAGGAGEATCTDVVDCLVQCAMDFQSCPMECMAEASKETTEGACLIAADAKAHPLETWVLSCLGGDGDMSCKETRECFFDCGFGMADGETDPPCLIECMKNTSVDAMEKWQVMMGTFDGEVDHSLMVLCVGGNGDLSCGDVLTCSEPCGPDTPGCFDDCLTLTAPEAIPAVHDFFHCMEELCPMNFFPDCPFADECMPACVGDELPE